MNMRIMCFLCFVFFIAKGFAQFERYDYENWNGKNSSAKKSIVIEDDFVNKYGLSIRKSYDSKYVSYRIALDESDSIKKGILRIYSFLNPTEAQTALMKHFNNSSSYKVPPRMDGELKYLDVAFGNESNDILELAFTKNNFFVFMQAPTKTALMIAKEIADKIEVASIYSSGEREPNIVFKERKLNIDQDSQ